MSSNSTGSQMRLLFFGVSFVCAILGVVFSAQPLFAMSKVGAVALYFLIWWVVLFITLPLGVENETHTAQATQANDLGAPSAPKMLRKAILTTWLSAFVFVLAAYGLILAGF